MTQVMMMIDR